MEGVRHCIFTPSPPPTRSTPFLHRARIIPTPIGHNCCMADDRNHNSLVNIFPFHNTRTHILVTVPIQDPFSEGCPLSLPCQVYIYFMASRLDIMAVEHNIPGTITEALWLGLEALRSFPNNV